jgi:hypothetical protein
MRSPQLAILLLALSSGLAQAAPVDIPPGEQSIRYLGRSITPDSPSEAQWSWSGSGASITFDGTACWIRMTAPGAFYRVLVDGKVTATLDLTNKYDTIHALAANLPAGTHTVAVRLRTEANNSMTRFHGFRIEGVPGKAPEGSPRRIEFYGNSITCGYGILDSVASNPFATRTEDEGLTYAAISADSVGADRHTICWSGKGVVQNYNRDTKNPTLPKLYAHVVPWDSTHLWDFSKWIPDVVAIDLGTNDFSHVAPDSVLFHRTFAAFVDTLHARYPKAKFVLLDGPMLSDGYPAGLNALTKVRRHMDNVAAAANAKGISTSRLSLAPQDASRGYGADYHPNRAQARLNGQELTAHLRKTMGWDGVPSGIARKAVGKARLVADRSGWAAWTPAGAGPLPILDAQGRTLHVLRLTPGSTTPLPASRRTTWIRIDAPEGAESFAIPPVFD